MRVAQTIVAVALVAAGVAEANSAAVEQSQANGVAAQKPVANGASQPAAAEAVPAAKAAVAEAPAAAASAASSSTSTESAAASTAPVAAATESAKAEPAKAEAAKVEPAKAAPAKAESAKKEPAKKAETKKSGDKKSIVDKVKGVADLAFGKVERKKDRTSKDGAQYIRKQKSAAELTTDASGTAQPASLSDPKVNLMEAMADLVKRYAGQATPDKAQLQEDIKTVFESRAEKGDLTTKQFRQAYKVRELTPNGVGKPVPAKTKAKRDLESRDLESEAEIDIAAREAEPEPETEEEFDVMAREAEAEADPEAEVYEDSYEFAARAPEEDEDLYFFARGEDGAPSTHSGDAYGEAGHSHSASELDSSSEWSPKTKSAETDGFGGDAEDELAEIEKKKAALKKALKKLARKQKLAKKLAAKKRKLAKKLAAKRKAAAAAYAAEEGSDEYSTPIPPTRPERPFYRAPSERRSIYGAMHYPRDFDMTMEEMW